MRPRFVEGEGGLSIATWELGGDGPPLMLAHATGFNTGCLRALAAELVDRFRVVGFDLRGHGHSSTPAISPDEDGRVSTMDWRVFAEDALAVVDALGLRGAVAFGHSCGGAVILLAELQRPGTFARIFAYEPVVAPPEFWAGVGERDPARVALGRRPGFPSRQIAIEHYSAKPPLSSMRADVLAGYIEFGFAELPDGTVSLRCRPEVEAVTYAMAPYADTFERLAEVACPTTFSCGGARADFNVDAAAVLAGRVQRGRVEEHPELGHLGPMERPDEIARAVAAIPV